MSEEQEIASQEPTAVEEETPVITSEKTKEDTLTEEDAQEDSPDVTEETQDVDLLGLDNEEVQQDEAADDSNDIIQEPEDVQQETEEEKETLLEDVPIEETEEEEEAPMEDIPIEDNTVKDEVVVQDAETPPEETPMEDVAIEEVEPQSANEETEVEEESPVEDVPIEEAVEGTPLEDVPIEEEELPSAANEETVVEVENAPMEDVPIEEAAVEDVPIEQEVRDEASEPVPEAPVDIIGDEYAQEPVEEETTIPTVESKDLEEALEETEQDAKLNAEAEELAQAVDRNINIDPAVVASAGVATAAVGAVAATSIAKEEAPEAQDSNLIRPIVIAGPSGAGKGTLIEGLMKRFPNAQFGFSVSHTSRKPREGEVNGVHYNFTSVESIKAEIDAGKFIEYAEVHGNYYGTSVDAVKSVQEQGKVCILDIDVQGVRNVKKSSLKPYYIFIAPPSMEDLEARLRGRGTEKEEDIQKRLANAAGEIQFGKEPGNFDKYLVNGNLAIAANDLAGNVKKWYPHLKEVAVDQNESNFVQDCVTTAIETCIIS